MSKITEDTQDYVCSISPSDFEKFCLEVLEHYAEEEELKNFSIDHDVKVEADDGIYQIDIYASFTALSVNFRILCECKQYTSPVKRERVELLEGRLKNLGMQKGILLSTSGFQSGAIKYAKAHGIALIQVFDHSCHIVSHSAGPDTVTDNGDPFQYIEDHWPPYRAICFKDGTDEPIVLFPTAEIVNEIYAEANKLLKEQYGIEVSLPEDNSP